MIKSIFTGKIKFVYLLELLLLALLIPFMFKKNETIYHVDGNEFRDSSSFQCPVFKTGIGLYTLKIDEFYGSNSIVVDFIIQQDRFQKAYGNGVVVYPNQHQTSFSYFCVLPGFSNIKIESPDNSLIGDASITLIKDRRTYGMFFIMLAFFFICVDALILFFANVKKGIINRTNALIAVTLFLAVFAASVPCMSNHIYNGDDTFFHLIRIRGLADSIKNMTSFPIRIDSYWNFDHGYANPSFYSDLFIFPFALLNLAGFQIDIVFRAYIICSITGIALSSFFCLKECTKDNTVALLGSLFYLFSPYTLYNIHSRAAVGEYTAMIYIPVVFMGMYKLYSENKQKHAWISIAVGMSLILECHLISTLIVSGFIALTAIVFCKKTFKEGKIFSLIAAAGATVILNAAFLIPMVYQMLTGDFRYQTNLSFGIQKYGAPFIKLFQAFPFIDQISFSVQKGAPTILGIVFWITVILYFICIEKKFSDKNKRTIVFLTSLCIIGLIMCTNIFPWNALFNIPVIGSLSGTIQFPYRILAEVTFIAAACFSRMAMDFKNDSKLKKIPFIAVSFVIILGLFYTNDYQEKEEPVYLYTAETLGTISYGGGEYLLPETVGEIMLYHDPVSSDNVIWSDYQKNGSSVSVHIDNTGNDIGYLEIPMFAYQGFVLTESSSSSEPAYISEEKGTHGDIKITVPAGYSGTVKVQYKESTLFIISDIITIVGIVALIFVSLKTRRKKKEI